MLTEATTRFGQAIVSGLFRRDVNLLVPAEIEGASSSQYAWARLFIANTERVVAWLVLWPAAHFTMVIVGVLAGLKRIPAAIVVPVEMIPSLMLAWSLPRAFYTFRQLKRVSQVVSSAKQLGVPPPSWALRPDWRYRVVHGSDWEIGAVVIFAALFAWFLSR